MTHIDYDREIALVVEGGKAGQKAIYGVARLSKLSGTDEEARFTMLISDAWQGRGLGRELLQRMLKVGREERIRRIIALMSPDNNAMVKLCKAAGLSSMEIDPENGMLKAQIDLTTLLDPSVIMRVKLDPTGKVTGVAVLKSSGSGEVDLPTQLAVWQWWIEPASRNGKAVPDAMILKIGYR